MDPSVFKQSQFELFPGSSDRTPDTARSRFSVANLTFSLESLIVLGVFIIVGMVVSYGLGVERGQRVARARIQQTGTPVLPAADVGAQTVKDDTPAVSDSGKIAAHLPQKDTPKIEPAAVEAPKLPEAVPAVVPEKTVDKGYTIQVASFKQLKFAHQEAQTLQKKGYQTLVMPKGRYSIVCVGTFGQKDEAKLMARDLRKTYKDLLVRSL